ncbi:MAG: hypothetical protein ACETWK_03240 [Candidatus Aminicenantaceae bacterium]
MYKKIFVCVLLSASLAIATPSATQLTKIEFSGGCLTTSNLNAWSGVNGVTYSTSFNVDTAGVGNVGLRMYVYGLDMSTINYEGDWGWPPDPGDLGAIVAAGVAGDPTIRFDMANGCWNQLHSSPGSNAGSWDGFRPVDHDNGYRKWFRQVWSSDMLGNKIHPDGPSHMYNVESYVVPNANHPSGGTGNPSNYCTFDLKIEITPLDTTSGSKQYKMETWSRMNRAASNDEGCNWKWNTAIEPVPPQKANPENAWAGGWPPGSYRELTHNDFATVFPFVNIANWGTQQTQYHTICWDSLVVEGILGPIIIAGCNTGVTDKVLEDGTTISGRIAECADDAKNHGQFVNCVSHLTNELKKAGIITGKEKGAINSCAAQASIPY